MEKSLGQFIEENKTVVSVLAKAAQIPTTVLRSHQIYKHYQGLKEKSKMVRYELTAQDLGTNTKTVRIAVKNMQKPI